MLYTYIQSGTFTPQIDIGFATGLSITYTIQTGYYTRIGRAVFFLIAINCVINYTTAPGNFAITGLPFSPFPNVSQLTKGYLSNVPYPLGYTIFCGTSYSTFPYVYLSVEGSGKGSVNIGTPFLLVLHLFLIYQVFM